MLLLGEQDFAASGHNSFDAKNLVMVALRQATSVSALKAIVSQSMRSSTLIPKDRFTR